ncbi:conserved hypothetical protein [Nostocoides japonicum T1-X7]|uniref:Integral membrane protein n=1 Tax=Nostocoides japonicum T1-X7 TaxID=1194083 RepID=A0A077LT08_9MICO|nr:hypothetical protein [Tetrasphaera japonica]CCH76448.1 conserved hypothetical protein [Tetrasphaera japonica T1-X7]
MTVVIHILLVLHLLGMAAILAGWTAYRMGAGKALAPLVWGARAQIVTGLLLVGLNEADDQAVNHAKIGVKLLVALGVVACAEIANARGRREKGEVRTLVDAAGALTVVNVCIAVLWTSAS